MTKGDLFDQDAVQIGDPADDWLDVEQFQDLEDGEWEQVRGKGYGLRWVLFTVLALVAVAAIVGGAIGLWALRQINPPGEPGETVTLTIESGMSTTAIADLLKDQGVITNTAVFRWYVGWKDAGPFRAGTYEVQQRASMGDVIAALEAEAAPDPTASFVKVTFPEGFTLEKIAARLEAEVPRLSAEEFVRVVNSGIVLSDLARAGMPSFEGLLFPDTYQIYAHETEADVAERMTHQMEIVAQNLKYHEFGFVQPYDLVIIASLIEKEAKVPEDRAKIARVIYNRLQQGMPLEIDATVLYALEKEGVEFDKLTFDLIESTDSPWNTYKIVGLPPSPIASPGRASLEATLHPADGDWLFYVVIDADGRHAFAETFAEHQANIRIAEANGVR